ncbi:nuclear export factor GLE1 [Kyrpidia tusciae DSM 2912]|uniref:Nuclear export factor GLE1 n=2 Tax=Kyrpidia TaxID=1129704 RepID=D5WT20_KYRT2|nr:nuclear export factor GLE1 [Kyrpidia tusciae DSM 2912]
MSMRRVRMSGPLRVAALMAFFVLVFTGVASAHVTVWPKESRPGAWEKYTVRVPTEKDVPTVKIVLKVPDGVSVESMEPVPGWSYDLQKENGRVTAVVWQAAGEGIKPGEFQEFSFQAKNPQQSGELSWKAYQYYKDGSVVEWTGPQDEKTPAAVTVVGTPTAGTSAAGPAVGGEAGTPAAGAPAAPAAGAGVPAWAPWTALGLSIVSLILSLFATVKSGRKGAPAPRG